MGGLSLVSAPADAPVSLETAKLQVNVTGTARDELLRLYLSAATDRVEQFTGRALVDQTWDLFLDAFPASDGFIEIPKPPLIELQGVFYTDDAGDELEMAAEDYIVDASVQPARVTLLGSSWPTPRAAARSVRLRFRAGYLDGGASPPTANVPAAIKASILLFVGDLYAHRETVVVGETAAELPAFLDPMLRPYRVLLGMA